MRTKTEPSADDFQPLPTTRVERGREIAKRGGIRQVGARFVVPSQSIAADASSYVVDLVNQTCTCPDYELRRLPCKHQEAAPFWIAWERVVSEEPVDTRPPKRPTYRQNWTAYNAAQTTEKARVETFTPVTTFHRRSNVETTIAVPIMMWSFLPYVRRRSLIAADSLSM